MSASCRKMPRSSSSSQRPITISGPVVSTITVMPWSGPLPWWKVPISGGRRDRAVLLEDRHQVSGHGVGGAPLDAVAGQEVHKLAILEEGDRRAGRRDVRE